MDLRIVQDKWNPSDTIILINCKLRGNQLSVGLAWFKRQIVSDFITVSDIHGERIDIIVPDELKRQDDSIVQINSIFEVVR
jgi:hypothetical protein